MAAAEKEWIGRDLEGRYSLPCENHEGCLELSLACRVAKDDPEAKPRRRLAHLRRLYLGDCSCWVEQHGDWIGIRHRLVEKAEPLAFEGGCELINAGYVDAWPIKARNEPEFHRIASTQEDDRDGGCCTFGGEGGSFAAHRGNYCHLCQDQISRQRGKAVIVAVCPALFNPHSLAFDEPLLPEAGPECVNEANEGGRRGAVKDAYYRNGWLLCSRSKRPHGSRTAD